MARSKKELTEEEIGEPVAVEVKQQLDKIVPIRLSADHWAELHHYAREIGVGPTTLGRMWILEKLAFIRTSTLPIHNPTIQLQRMTWRQYMERLDSVMPEDLKKKMMRFMKDSVIPPNTESFDETKALIMSVGPDSEFKQLVLELYRAIALLSGIELIEDAELEVEDSKLKV